ncbi:hypothetical protein BTR14_13105 [Rhizobium rhizosphaerae]|uniref:Uncharacterized protein n=1 Tax=Xaviernesmea rhizosphaerae TaxID=1672749 RepID=A0ABX3PC54_9HYPH|nr:hypothetical protein [Xaviernesmea rhizosphaerae]OQP86015.1 hypothetical protein BTR14_13105 [Xaviernesmea rhizosphaerae]
MTILNVVLERDAVHVFTDTRATWPDGSRLADVPKVIPLPHMRAVIAVRGEIAALGKASTIACMCGNSFDELMGKLALALKAEHSFLGTADVVVAGWSADGPQAFAVFTHDGHGIAPFTRFDISYALFTPVLTPSVLKSVETTGPLRGLPLAVLDQVQSEPLRCGGVIQVTSVYEHAITASVAFPAAA